MFSLSNLPQYEKRLEEGGGGEVDVLPLPGRRKEGMGKNPSALDAEKGGGS